MCRGSIKLMKILDIALSGRLFLVGISIGCIFGLAAAAQAAPKEVLVVTVTTGFRHTSIPTAEKVLAELGSFQTVHGRSP